MIGTLHTGDCLDVVPSLGLTRFDSIVTDPPYGLGFMGKAWDRGVPGPLYWERMRAVIRPGGYLVAFGGTRTFHRLTCAIEDAGWEIHDCLCWLYGSGFPKHESKLKPAWEPIILARRPADVATALNIDACRIDGGVRPLRQPDRYAGDSIFGAQLAGSVAAGETSVGRWPANVVVDEEAAAALDDQTGTLTSGAWNGHRTEPKAKHTLNAFGAIRDERSRAGDSGGASRFYYCAKASRTERDAGLEDFPLTAAGSTRVGAGSMAREEERGRQPRAVVGKNDHPTVKPIALMRWLTRLVTPIGGSVLDPFAGSGTTGCAAALEGFSFDGIELDEYFTNIGRARMGYWSEIARGGQR